MLLSEFLSSPLSQKPHLVVIGHPVSHSRSPRIHNLAVDEHSLDIRYYAVDCPEKEWDLIPNLLASQHIHGVNVTIPLKKQIIRYLNGLDESAREIGAVNTVVPVRSGPYNKSLSQPESCRLIGYNTDTYGFMKPLESLIPFPVATILGSGGASKAVRYALTKAGTKKIYLVSRFAQTDSAVTNAGEISVKNHLASIRSVGAGPATAGTTCTTIPYSDLAKAVQESDLIVNTTPAGMYPDIDASPVPDNIYPEFSDKTCYDIIYNPLETSFLKNAKKHGARVIGGLDMFVYQAARSFALWFDKPMPVERVRNLMMEDLKL